MPFEPGSRFGSFEVLSRIGAGGMGEVWKARDTRLQREVALKVLPEAFAQDPDRLARFTREAHVLASLNHANIASIYSLEEIDGIPLLVLELVTGETLKERVLRAPIPADEALRIGLQIADALGAAHAKGILHRDLKPANVLLTPEGKVKLLDFGLAKAFALGAASPDITHSPTAALDPTRQGVVLGTASYMSPEQARSRALDGRSDLWSFGCLLYEMLAGRKAFDGESVSDILVAILDREPDWSSLPAGTPAPLRDVLKRLLEKDPAKRPADVGEMRVFLEAAAGSRTTTVIASGFSASFARRGGGRKVLVAAAVLLAVGGALLWLSMHERSGKALPASKLLAILPALDLTGREDGRQLCDGVSFSLGVKLQSIPGIAIMPPSSPAMLKETDPAKWARDTGANLLVQPAVRQMGDTRELSFSIKLAGSPVQLAAGEVSGPAAEHFRLEEEITEKIAAALKIHLATGAAVPTPARTLPAGPQQTDYIVALGYLEKRDPPSLEKAVATLEGLPGASRSGQVQATLARARFEQYAMLHDPASLAAGRRAAEAAVALAPDLREAQVALGRVLTESGRAADAVVTLTKTAESAPGDPGVLFALAAAQEKTGALEAAEATFRRAAALRPSSWDSWNKLAGFLVIAANKYDEAENTYRKAITLNPDRASLHANLGSTLIRLGRTDEARSELNASIALSPNYHAFLNLGVVEYLSRNFAAARAAYVKAADLAPKNPRPLVFLADALAHQGAESDSRATYEKALRLLEAALKEAPEDASWLVLKGRCEAGLKRPGAMATLQRAVRAAPKDSGIFYQAAAVAALSGHTDAALGWLGEARRLGLGPAQLARDPDLDSLRTLPAFEALLKPLPTAPAGRP